MENTLGWFSCTLLLCLQTHINKPRTLKRVIKSDPLAVFIIALRSNGGYFYNLLATKWQHRVPQHTSPAMKDLIGSCLEPLASTYTAMTSFYTTDIWPFFVGPLCTCTHMYTLLLCCLQNTKKVHSYRIIDWIHNAVPCSFVWKMQRLYYLFILMRLIWSLDTNKRKSQTQICSH